MTRFAPYNIFRPFIGDFPELQNSKISNVFGNIFRMTMVNLFINWDYNNILGFLASQYFLSSEYDTYKSNDKNNYPKWIEMWAKIFAGIFIGISVGMYDQT